MTRQTDRGFRAIQGWPRYEAAPESNSLSPQPLNLKPNLPNTGTEPRASAGNTLCATRSFKSLGNSGEGSGEGLRGLGVPRLILKPKKPRLFALHVCTWSHSAVKSSARTTKPFELQTLGPKPFALKPERRTSGAQLSRTAGSGRGNPVMPRS